MIWENSSEMMNELLLTLGMGIIILGFIFWMGFTPFEIALSGIIIVMIATWRIIKLKQIDIQRWRK